MTWVWSEVVDSQGIHAPLKAAMDATQRGWRVHPTNGKRPALKDWPNQASTATANIQLAWGQESTRYGVGIACGAGSGIFVLDIDNKGGTSGSASLSALEDENSPLPETYTVHTPSGGYHYYFQYPEKGTVTNSVSALGPGIDVRGEAGHVMAGGTGGYGVVNETDPAEAPEWLLKKVTRKARRASTKPSDDHMPVRQAQRVLQGHAEGLQALYEDAGDGWDNSTFKIFCLIAELVVSEAVTENEGFAVAFNNAPRDTNFTDDFIEKKWEHCLERVKEKHV